mmetsp:Transcript_28194/g.28480  ORF Transcript_28194/g.28480 Transcript_28194/m.28480 type:complete len:170 (-) Transcript_28194:17-526(-)
MLCGIHHLFPLLLCIHGICSLQMPKFGGKKSITKTNVPDVILPKSYTVAGEFIVAGVVAAGALDNTYIGIPLIFFGLYLSAQVGRINFTFQDKAFEILIQKQYWVKPKDLTSSENTFVGGKNRWSYNGITRWGFFPFKQFPILFYFFENETQPEKNQFHLCPMLMVSIR